MDLLRKLVASPAVRKAFVAPVLAVLAAAGVSLSAGCGGSLPPAVAARFAVLECQHAALETVVPAYVAEDLVMAARAGNVGYVVKQLLALGLTVEQIQGVADAFNACEGGAESDAGAPEPPALERSGADLP